MNTEQIEDLIPEIDLAFLKDKNFRFTYFREAGAVHIVLHDFPIPMAYTPQLADLMIVLPAGYPNANLDMFWTSPDVKLLNGNWPQQCDQHTIYNNINWQRWSRHFPTGWRQGVDNLRTFIASVRRDLSRGI